MVGLSRRLSSLVQAADDPYVVFYTLTHLGFGVPHGSGGFRDRVERLREKIFNEWLRRNSPWELMKRQQKEAIREQQEIAELNRQEQQLALQLFQTSSVQAVERHLVRAKPEELEHQVANKDPLVRFLAIQVISGRHLHLESALIQRLNDLDPLVRDAARTALIRVSRGTDFGPARGASQRGIQRSIEKWQQWLALQTSASRETLAKGTADTAAEKKTKSSALEMVQFVLVPDDRPMLSPEAAKLSDELVNAKDEEQMSVLARLRDAKGIDNTDGLALAIPKLSGGIKRQARDALSERLTRMTTATLRDKLQDDNVEVRCAAALACGHKNARETIPDLLQLLDDPERDVIQTARVVLTELTGKDFGPKSDAGRHGCAEAAAAWRNWWSAHRDPQK